MIISKTPFRISFFGGGTDFPYYYSKKDDVGVISTSINKYCYISIRELPNFFYHFHRISYSKIEEVNSNDEINHPVIRAVFNLFGVNRGIELHYDGDMPSRSGLGSSSSFTVGMLNSMMELYNQKKTKKILAEKAIHIEQHLLKEEVGCQDQIISSYGGFNHIIFNKDQTFKVDPININPEQKKLFNEHLMLFYTGIQRYATDIESSKLQNSVRNEIFLDNILKLKNEALNLFSKNFLDISMLGKLLLESWEQKKSLSNKVSLPLIDNAYYSAIESGALGGKLLGAGGGGFLLFLVRPKMQNKIRERLKDLLEVNFSFENQGSKIIFNSNKND